MGVHTIDINCDLGEGLGNEAAIMPLISSCNIACGGHAGDVSTMESVVALAKMHKVKVGAHPSFPDRSGFGRRFMDLSPEALRKTLYEQIKLLSDIVTRHGVRLHHVKPHGALYNLATVDRTVATAVVDTVKHFGGDVKLYAPYQSSMAYIASEKGVEVVFEAFADRNYNVDLTLVSRDEEGAMILKAEAMCHHICGMVREKKVTTLDGEEVSIKADTFCVHGDGENVVENLKELALGLGDCDIEIL